VNNFFSDQDHPGLFWTSKVTLRNRLPAAGL